MVVEAQVADLLSLAARHTNGDPLVSALCALREDEAVRVAIDGMGCGIDRCRQVSAGPGIQRRHVREACILRRELRSSELRGHHKGHRDTCACACACERRAESKGPAIEEPRLTVLVVSENDGVRSELSNVVCSAAR